MLTQVKEDILGDEHIKHNTHSALVPAACYIRELGTAISNMIIACVSFNKSIPTSEYHLITIVYIPTTQNLYIYRNNV